MGAAHLLLGRRSVQAGYVVSAVVLSVAALVVARRAHWDAARTAVGVAAALSLALLPALTLARRGLDLRRRPTCDWAWALEPTNAEQVLNLVLLLPAGFFAAWALRRVWPVVLAAGALSLAVEALQATLDIGACQAGDMARNAAGASRRGRRGAARPAAGAAWVGTMDRMTRDDVRRWVAGYERAWRTAGTDELAALFTDDVTYVASPWADPVVGLPALAKFWEAERDGPDEASTSARRSWPSTGTPRSCASRSTTSGRTPAAGATCGCSASPPTDGAATSRSGRSRPTADDGH